MLCPYCRIELEVLDENDAVSLVYNPAGIEILMCPSCEYMTIEIEYRGDNQ